jgi:glutamine amidotransferase
MNRICVLDYGVGNLRSVSNAIAAAGAEAVVSSDPAVALAADGMVVPGVGAFPHVLGRLRDSGLDKVVTAAVSRGSPVLGICVGMQLLFEKGLEFEPVPGLGFFQGTVERIVEPASPIRLPHIAWTVVKADSAVSGMMFSGIPEIDRRFYFLHSFAASGVPEEFVAARARYEGQDIVAAVRRDRLWGTQFHPEKSGAAGLQLLRNFIANC